MDKRFVRAEGCWLWDEDGERYLDFIAMYGAVPFGFNHPDIWGAVEDVRTLALPSFAQPSMLDAAGELAQRLIELAPPGLDYATFANSGAEAVEAAVKLARAAAGKPGILSTDNGFHGKTLGALSATGRDYYQRPFGAPVEGFSCIPYGDLAALEAELRQNHAQIAAFIVEPIQGEGGIVEPPPGYLAGVRELCSRYGVLMIVDEIQTGLGRTGHLFVCGAERVKPDALLVAKALGGGLVPIGAILSADTCYTEEFAIKHTSTFAANSLACRVGLRTLELLTRDDEALMWRAAENGAYLKAELEKAQRRYPQILTAVRGRGYMLGLQFNDDRTAYGRQCLLGPMAEQEMLTAVIASYMLNVEKIRVAPTLNGASVLRLEPPLIADRAMCDQVVGAIDRLLAILAAGNTAQLMAHLVGRDGTQISRIDTGKLSEAPKSASIRVNPRPQKEDGRFAFLVHPLTPRSYVDFDTSLAVFDDDELADLTGRWQGTVEPFVVGATRIVSATDAAAYGEFIGIPFTADELMAMPQAEAAAELRKGVELARERGARLVGLGSYTSIASQNGRLLADAAIPLTTGNSYTVVSTVQAIAAMTAERGVELAGATVAIVGATGSIGRATALLLAERAGRLILIGNPAHPEQSLARLEAVADEIAGDLALDNGAEWRKMVGDGRLFLTTDADQFLPQADVVVTAASTTQKLLTPQNLKRDAIVCDTSQPSNVSETIGQERPDVLVMEGGIIAVPGRPDLGWQFGLEPGCSFACMAETMMLALEKRVQHGSLG
ncbi:MAG: aminotransferase class III-fold pyridoxal phosphate-dependent enzyme, partial [Chloroflexi bacterium]|nr:aminotransferase class III-fold pyridoxal phosphate-dependent enzyme [Chloroflexota bacterium]